MIDEQSPSAWHTEFLEPGLVQQAVVTCVLFEGRSAHQTIKIIDTQPFGRTLVLDDRVQSAEADEWVYHEALVQPVMLAHPLPRRVFIAGGGEGATAREVLRHRSVGECVMVDLDREVLDLCKRHLPNHHAGAFDDPRLTLHVNDAVAYLRAHDGLFDVIVIDVPDPLEGGPAYLLYTEEFYRLACTRLTPRGILVTQAGPAAPSNVTETLTAINRTMGSALGETCAYRVFVPSFGTMWGYVAAGRPGTPSAIAAATPEQIDARIAERLLTPLRYYDGRTHQGMLGLPKYVRQALADERRVITESNPVYAV